jgi:hypothetical protein
MPPKKTIAARASKNPPADPALGLAVKSSRQRTLTNKQQQLGKISL